MIEMVEVAQAYLGCGEEDYGGGGRYIVARSK